MASKVTVAEIKARIAASADTLALDLLPADSFARHAYETKPYPILKRENSAANADKADCQKWGLTAEEWAEQMAVARIAMAHDMKLDLLKEGFF
jgi:hypothetical protein